MKITVARLLAAALACALFVGCPAETAPSAPEALPSAAAQSESAPTGEDASGTEQEEISVEDLPPTPESETPAPVHGNQVADGVYPIEVTSSSSMFRIVDAQLTVEGGEMSAVLTLSGTGYEKLFMGTGEEALAGTDEQCIYFVEDAEGKYTYNIPVPALDAEVAVAAFSIRKQTWYDRVLVFQSAQIPQDAITAHS